MSNPRTVIPPKDQRAERQGLSHPRRRRSDASPDRAPFIPTEEWITRLSPGDLAPDCFGHWSPVVEITYRGVDQGGQAYVGAWLEFGSASRISHSYKVGRPVVTIPGGSDPLRLLGDTVSVKASPTSTSDQHRRRQRDG